MIEYAEEIKSGRVKTEVNEAMRWGSMCEDHAIATYVNGMSCKKYKKTGLWSTTDTDGCCCLGVSPDGLVDEDIIVEIKGPYMGGNQFPYGKVPVVYIPQCQLGMFATNRSKCHFVCWTPKRTLVYLIKRDDKFIDKLVAQLKIFWQGAMTGNILKSSTSCDNHKATAEKKSVEAPNV